MDRPEGSVACRFCGAWVTWCETITKRKVPLEGPSYAGRFRITEGTKGERYAVSIPKGAPASSDRYRNHLYVCPKMQRSA